MNATEPLHRLTRALRCRLFELSEWLQYPPESPPLEPSAPPLVVTGALLAIIGLTVWLCF